MTERSDSMDRTTIPTTWSALIRQNAELLDASLDMLRDRPDEANEAGAAGEFGANPVSFALVGASGVLAQAAVTRGAKGPGPLLKVLAPLVPGALEELSGEITNDSRALAMSVGLLVNVAQCSGFSLSPAVADAAVEAQNRWSREVASFGRYLNDRERASLSLAALAWDSPPSSGSSSVQSTDSGADSEDADSSSGDTDELIVRIIGGGALPKTFVPSQVFEFNTQGFIRYLALAVRTGQSLTSVLPALESFIRHFPHKLAAGQLDWDELLLAGRVVFSIIGKEPESAVADAMYALITTQSFEDGL